MEQNFYTQEPQGMQNMQTPEPEKKPRTKNGKLKTVIALVAVALLELFNIFLLLDGDLVEDFLGDVRNALLIPACIVWAGAPCAEKQGGRKEKEAGENKNYASAHRYCSGKHGV